jgi:hypothetical protein
VAKIKIFEQIDALAAGASVPWRGQLSTANELIEWEPLCCSA